MMNEWMKLFVRTMNSGVLPLFFQEDCRRVRTHEETFESKAKQSTGCRDEDLVFSLGLNQLGTTAS